MKEKADVIDSFFRDFKSECDGFFKAHIDGIWTNGYCHGRQDALNEIIAISELSPAEEGE